MTVRDMNPNVADLLYCNLRYTDDIFDLTDHNIESFPLMYSFIYQYRELGSLQIIGDKCCRHFRARMSCIHRKLSMFEFLLTFVGIKSTIKSIHRNTG